MQLFIGKCFSSTCLSDTCTSEILTSVYGFLMNLVQSVENLSGTVLSKEMFELLEIAKEVCFTKEQ